MPRAAGGGADPLRGHFRLRQAPAQRDQHRQSVPHLHRRQAFINVYKSPITWLVVYYLIPTLPAIVCPYCTKNLSK